GEASGGIRVTGLGGEGDYVKYCDVAEAESSADSRALRFLWARAKVARLSDYGADTGEETRREITTLGLTYELLTAYTSFIAVHEQVRTTEGSQTVEQPLPLPQGVADSAVGNSVPEPELPLLVVLALLLLALTPAGRAWLG